MEVLPYEYQGAVELCVETPYDFVDYYIFTALPVASGRQFCVVPESVVAMPGVMLEMQLVLAPASFTAALRCGFAGDWVQDVALQREAERVTTALLRPYEASLHPRVFHAALDDVTYRLILLLGLVRFLGRSRIVLSSDEAPVTLAMEAMGIAPSKHWGDVSRVTVQLERGDGA